MGLFASFRRGQAVSEERRRRRLVRFSHAAFIHTRRALINTETVDGRQQPRSMLALHASHQGGVRDEALSATELRRKKTEQREGTRVTVRADETTHHRHN